MSKSMRKGEKLDFLIKEMSKIRSGLKDLLKKQASLADEIKRLGKPSPKAAKKPAGRKPGSAKLKSAAPAVALPDKRKSPVVLQVAPPPAAKTAG